MWRWRKAKCALCGAALLAGVGPAMAQNPQGDVDPRLCQALGVNHRPAPDVEYVPGVDVRGRAVAPADLPGSYGAMRQPLDRFEIPITLDFARRMGFSAGGSAAAVKVPGATEVGRLVIDGGRVTFNGQAVGDSSQAALAAACGRYR
ncbi:MAG TPA: hypothetical protein PKZ97_07250 [Azospirillaceae bacterium]|nr:hypothetical protein [Azospirillaceae bacterium]